MKIYFNSDFIITKREHEEYYQGSDYHNKLIVAFPKLAYEKYTYIYPVFNVKRADGRVFGEFAITDFDTTDANYMTWSCDLPNKALEVEGTLEITVLFRYSNDGKYAKVSTGKVLLNVKEAVIGEENDVIFTGSGDNLQGEIDAIRNEFGVRFNNVETHFISDMAELDSYTTPGLYKFNINNTNTFHLFVIKISDSLIGQTRSSRKGFYYRIINSGVASEWSYGSYNVNGITEYGSTISYNKGAIVNYLGDLYLSLIDENTTPLNESWSKLEFTKFVKLEELDNYVPKEEGKGLSSNDYTNEEKAKVSKSVAEDDLKTINGESIVGSGNIEVKGADVDLSNYYDIPTSNALLERKEDKFNLKALAYKDSLSKSDVGLGNVRNVESYSKTETDEKITDVIEIAEGKTKTFVVSTESNIKFKSNTDQVNLDISANPIVDISGKTINIDDIKVGDIFYVLEKEVADRWVSSITGNIIQLPKMETSKVDLNNYPTKTEISDLVNEYDAQLKNDIAEDYYNKTETDTAIDNKIANAIGNAEDCENFLGVNFNVELGNIDVNSGAELENASRARSDFIYLKNGYSIISKNNYIFYVIKFDNDKNWIGNNGAFVSNYEVTTDGYYRLMFVNNVIGNLTNSLDDLKENIYILTNKSDFNKYNVQNDIQDLKTKSENIIVNSIYLTFEKGGLDINSGVINSSANRARSTLTYIPKGFIIKSIDDDYKFRVLQYTDKEVFQSTITSSDVYQYETIEDGFYKLLIFKQVGVSDITSYLDIINNAFYVKKKSNIYIVSQNRDGDFNDIQTALDFTTNIDTKSFPITIKVNPGTYDKISTCERKKYVNDNLASHIDYTERYISIIGVNKNECIIKSDNGEYYTPAAEIKTNGLIKNLTFMATHENLPTTPENADHKAYAIHSDYGVEDCTYEDCIMISYQAPAMGIGGAQNKKIKIRNCQLYSYATSDFGTLVNHGALFYHTQPSENITGQELLVENCYVYSENGNKSLWIDKGSVSSLGCEVTLINNMFYGKVCKTAVDVDLDLLTDESFGNNVESLNKNASSGGSSGKKYMHLVKIYSSAKISDSTFKFCFTMYIISNSSTAYSTLVAYYNEIGDRKCMANGVFYGSFTSTGEPVGQVMYAWFSSSVPVIDVAYTYLDNSSSSNKTSNYSSQIVWGNSNLKFNVVGVYEI